MALANAAEEYFSNINPIASRIFTDLKETKGNYEDLWNSLSQEEQDQILTESIIKPEVLLKYRSDETKIDKEYAVKIVVDDHCSYRDEHSGPFSFRTKSQRNLTVFQGEQSKNKTGDTVVKAKLKPVPKPPSIPLYAQELELEDISCDLSHDQNADSSLPKTGLDFLDNW